MFNSPMQHSGMSRRVLSTRSHLSICAHYLSKCRQLSQQLNSVSVAMQLNSTDSFGSMPTLHSAVTATSSVQDGGDVSGSTDIELGTTARDVTLTSSSGVYVARKRNRWNIPQKCDCLFRKTCIIYTMILATIWILFTIPIIAFYATVSGDSLVLYKISTSNAYHCRKQHSSDCDTYKLIPFFFYSVSRMLDFPQINPQAMRR